MKIKVEQLSEQVHKAIVECLREVGGTRYAPGSFNNHWHLELAMKKPLKSTSNRNGISAIILTLSNEGQAVSV